MLVLPARKRADKWQHKQQNCPAVKNRQDSFLFFDRLLERFGIFYITSKHPSAICADQMDEPVSGEAHPLIQRDTGVAGLIAFSDIRPAALRANLRIVVVHVIAS